MSQNGQYRHKAIRPDWLALRCEPIIEPEQPIIDAHHHLYDRPSVRYLLEDFLADIGQEQHDIRSTVYVQARAMLRQDGPECMKAVGETEFANGVAAMCASGIYGHVRVCAAVVGFADLTLGDRVRPVLEAHLATAGAYGDAVGRFRGIRQIVLWDHDQTLTNPAYQTTSDMLDSTSFRRGFTQVGALGLSFDAWLLFHQIPHLTRLACDFPQIPIVLNHCGGIAGTGHYAGRRDEIFSLWSAAMADLSQCPNVMVKLGGLGLALSGFGFDKAATPPSSSMLAAAWRPYMETLIDLFGTKRCMFESNFPADKGSYSYHIGWNAMKLIARNFSADEKHDLFWRSAARFYRLKYLL